MPASPLLWKRECAWRDEDTLDLDFAPTLDDVYMSYLGWCTQQGSTPWFEWSELAQFRRYIRIWGIKFRPRPADGEMVAPGWRVSGQPQLGPKRRTKTAAPKGVVLYPDGRYSYVDLDESED